MGRVSKWCGVCNGLTRKPPDVVRSLRPNVRLSLEVGFLCRGRWRLGGGQGRIVVVYGGSEASGGRVRASLFVLAGVVTSAGLVLSVRSVSLQTWSGPECQAWRGQARQACGKARQVPRVARRCGQVWGNQSFLSPGMA